LPENYDQFISDEISAKILNNKEEQNNPYNYPVGITAYENFFSHEELSEIEAQVEHTEA
jgi:hypothetical protein